MGSALRWTWPSSSARARCSRRCTARRSPSARRRIRSSKARRRSWVGVRPLSVTATSTSYTAQCLQLQQSKVDYAQLNIASAVAAKFIADCQAQNYNPTWGTSEQAIGKDLLSVPGVTAYGPAFAFPSVADAKPVATFRDAMSKYATSNDWREGAGSYTWQGLEIIRTALLSPASAPAGPVSSTAFTRSRARPWAACWPTG